MAHRSIPKNSGGFMTFTPIIRRPRANLWTIGLSFRSSGVLISIEPLALVPNVELFSKSTWALMLTGFMGIGFAGSRRAKSRHEALS